MKSGKELLKSVQFEERKDPTFIEFAKGEQVCGVLMNIEKIGMKDGGTNLRYTIMDIESGELQAFLGTAQLNNKIRKTDIGKVVEVTYEGEDKNVVRNGNAMKVFRVRISKDVVAPELVVTDADLPNF